MSSSKPKDEAERRAEELVRVVKGYDDQLNLHIGTHCDYSTTNASSMELARKEIVENIANAIREAIEGRDRIMTDMLSDSEAFHEGWRQGTKATLSKIANYFKTQYRPEILALPLPQPPSHTGTGEIFPPSDLAIRAQRMELALQEILKFSLQTGDSLAHPLHLAQRIAREALEE